METRNDHLLPASFTSGGGTPTMPLCLPGVAGGAEDREVRRMLALVVDDDPLVRALAGHVLRRAGMGCLGFANADDALPALAELWEELAVLITDVHMPGSLDGLGLVDWAARSNPGLPVVVMSGDADALAAASRLPAVLSAIWKPFAPDELARAAMDAASTRNGGWVDER